MKKNIDDLRADIDILDEKLFELLSERVMIARKIGMLKKEGRIELIDERRKKEVLEKWIRNLQNSGISKNDAEKLYHQIHDLSVAIERESE